MMEKLYPDAWVRSAYDIPYERLYKKGYRGVLFDIDNTLVPHGAPADDRAKQLFERLCQTGYACGLISNNRGKRVDMFNEEIHAYTICNAKKPLRESFIKASALMGVPADKILFVGDQIFTDIWGARRSGMYSILVKPVNQKEVPQVLFKRPFEKVVLHFYKKHRAKQKKS